jgi:hypothetical protein
MPVLRVAADYQRKKVIEYSEMLWRRSEGAAALGRRTAIDVPDVKLASAEVMALRQGGTALGLFGGLLAGAGGGALLAWLPEPEKVTTWQWTMSAVLLVAGVLLMIVLSLREK